VDASPPVTKRHTKRGRLGEMAEFAALLPPYGCPPCGMRSPNSFGRLGDLSSPALQRSSALPLSGSPAHAAILLAPA